MRPLADQRPLFISHVADVFLAGVGYCDNPPVVGNVTCRSCEALGSPSEADRPCSGNLHMSRSHCEAIARQNIESSSVNPVSSTSAYTCTRPPSANQLVLNIAKQTPGILFLPSEMTMPRKMFGDATAECSIFSLPRPQRSASVLITARKESAALLPSVEICSRRGTLADFN